MTDLDDARYLIDQALEGSRNLKKGSDSTFQKFTKDIAKVISGDINFNSSTEINDFYSEIILPDYRRIVSWSLLRYLGYHGQFPQEPVNLRPKLINFIHNEIGNELEQRYSINFSEQSHLIEIDLTKIVPQIEKDFYEYSRYTSLEEFASYAKQIQKCMNSKMNKGLLFTFIDRKRAFSKFEKVLSSVEAFCLIKNSKDAQVLDEFDNSIKACDACIQDLSNKSTSYSNILNKQVSLIKDAVIDEMQTLKFSEPAFLKVALEPKKYPLHIIDAPLLFRVKVLNNGKGNAFNCHLNIKETDSILINSTNIQVGNLSSEETRVIYVDAKVAAPKNNTILQTTISWTNFDGSDGRVVSKLKIESQDPGIDWEALEQKQPYSVEVAKGKDFYGRTQLLNRLRSLFLKPNPGSAYLWGQKRVGKTSVALALANELKKYKEPISVVYLETIREVTAEDTINKMCTRLIGSLRTETDALSSLPDIMQTGTLTPLSDFLEQAILVEPDRKFIIILDEFDELPIELYKARGIADTFFQTLGKGIAGKQNVGVLLVGGERIPVIIREQGMRLNMYRPEHIDYFNRDKEWDSFVDLIRKPGKPLEFDSEAIEILWNYSAGNPYFLKEIANRLSQMMIERRDAHITKDEVCLGLRRTLDEVEANSFAHYWDDGLVALEESDFIAQRSERVRFLLSVADILRSGINSFLKDSINQKALEYRCTSQDIERQLRSFQERGIIVAEKNNYKFRVLLFQEWLKERGYLDLTNIVASELQLAEKLERERSEIISGTEIRDVVEKWGSYQGRKRTESEVRDWLKQFGSTSDQRLMLKLLQNVKFYSDDIVREKFEQLHRSLVRKKIVTKIEEGRRKRRDIIVSYLGAPGSSGPSMARIYRQANQIYRDNCISPNEIHDKICESEEIAALIFADDFVGTGKTATELFRTLRTKHPNLPNIIKEKGIKLFYLTIAGAENGLKKIEKELTDNFTNLNFVESAEELGVYDMAFSVSSTIWSSETERATAEEIATSFGQRLEKRFPLGFGDMQALIVFEENCPNNSLPILYKKPKGQTSFIPLFPRS